MYSISNLIVLRKFKTSSKIIELLGRRCSRRNFRAIIWAHDNGVGRTVSRSASVRRSRGLTRRDFRSTGGNSIIRVPRQSVARKVRTPLETPPRHRWLPSVSSRGPSNFPHTASITVGSSLFFHDESLWSLVTRFTFCNFHEISSPRFDCEFFFSVKDKKEKKNGDGIFFFFSCIYGEQFFSIRREERERERAFHSRIPRQIRKRLFTLMRADKILRIPERRSLVGCNAVVSLVLPPPLVLDMCVYREIIGAPSNRTWTNVAKEWNLNDTRIILWAFICARIRNWSFHTFQIVSPYLLFIRRYFVPFNN